MLAKPRRMDTYIFWFAFVITLKISSFHMSSNSVLACFGGVGDEEEKGWVEGGDEETRRNSVGSEMVGVSGVDAAASMSLKSKSESRVSGMLPLVDATAAS